MLTMVRDSLPRQQGNGWKLPTFHNTMHIVSDMCKYGKPKESNTEVGEKKHKVFAKQIGRRCRKQHKTFSNQVAVRLSDSFVITKLASAMGLLEEEDKEDDCVTIPNMSKSVSDETTYGATHFTIESKGNNIELSWQSWTEKHLLSWDADVARFIHQHYMSKNSVTTIYCCTQYSSNKLLMRCHPSYKGEGPWFDWVNVHYDAQKINGKLVPEGNYPSKVMAIVPKQHNTFLEETFVVLCSAQSRTENDSVLFVEWELCDGYHILPISRVVESLFVLELGSNRIAVALSYSDWPSCFTNTSY